MTTRLLLVTMCVGYFLVLLDVSVINVALPQLGSQLHVQGAPLAWAVTAYSVPFASLLLVGGATGDHIGHRPVILAGLAVFGLASLGCALANGLVTLVVARACQGIGAALLLPGTLAVVTRAYPDPGERAKAISVWVAIGSLALLAGPTLGGVLVATLSWRSVFLLNVPLVAAALVLAWRVLPDDPGDRERRPDLLGTALGTLTLALLVAGVVQSNWLLAAGAAPMLAAFLVVERRRAQPVLPLRLFRDRQFTLANLGAVVMNGTALGMLFLLTQYLQNILHLDPLRAGLAILPSEVLLVAVPSLSGRLVARFGSHPVAVAALTINAAGLALLTLVGATSPYVALLPSLIVWGFGLGLLTPALVAGATSAVPNSQAGLASAINNTARQSGGALGTAACAALAGPVSAPRFLAGFHLSALLTAGLSVAMALATAALTTRAGVSQGFARPRSA